MTNKDLKRQKKGLLFFSSSSVLGRALGEWEFSHFGVFAQLKRCQWCGTNIQHFVAIRNIRNKACCLIGHDCYEQLRQGGAKEVWPSLAEQKKSFKKMLTIKQDGGQKLPVFLNWFAKQNRLPASLQEILRFTKRFGYPPSEAAARKLIGYYRNFCLFSPQDLLDFNTLREVEILRRWGTDRPLSRAMGLRSLKNLESWLARRKKDLAKSFRGENFGRAFWPLREAFIYRCSGNVLGDNYQSGGNFDFYFVLRNKVNGRWISVDISAGSAYFVLAPFWHDVSADEERRRIAWQKTAPAELEVWGFDPLYPLNWQPAPEALNSWQDRARKFLEENQKNRQPQSLNPVI